MAIESPAALLDRFNVSRESRVPLETYVAMLLTWQRCINLIGPSTVDHIWQRHVADALQLVPLMNPRARTVADLGSGAGIPGLIIAIVTGDHAHLYESNGKKAAFLREAIRHTKVQATVHQTRIETLRDDPVRPAVDVVLARALAPLTELLDYAAPFMDAGATGLFHKGKEVEAELTAAAQYWNLLYEKHPSMTDSRAVILEVKEARRVRL